MAHLTYWLFGIVVGYCMGRMHGAIERMRELKASPHEHRWTGWKCEQPVQGFLEGNSRALKYGEAQSRRCKDCGERELRTVWF